MGMDSCYKIGTKESGQVGMNSCNKIVTKEKSGQVGMNSCNKIETKEESGQGGMNSCNKIGTKFLHISISASTKIRASGPGSCHTVSPASDRMLIRYLVLANHNRCLLKNFNHPLFPLRCENELKRLLSHFCENLKILYISASITGTILSRTWILKTCENEKFRFRYGTWRVDGAVFKGLRSVPDSMSAGAAGGTGSRRRGCFCILIGSSSGAYTCTRLLEGGDARRPAAPRGPGPVSSRGTGDCAGLMPRA